MPNSKIYTRIPYRCGVPKSVYMEFILLQWSLINIVSGFLRERYGMHSRRFNNALCEHTLPWCFIDLCSLWLPAAQFLPVSAGLLLVCSMVSRRTNGRMDIWRQDEKIVFLCARGEQVIKKKKISQEQTLYWWLNRTRRHFWVWIIALQDLDSRTRVFIRSILPLFIYPY